MKPGLRIKRILWWSEKADWDVGLAVDAIRTSSNLDVIVLVSGDSDFVPVVEYLKNHGKRVEVVAFGKTSAHELIAIADEFIDLDINAKRYLLKGKFYERLNPATKVSHYLNNENNGQKNIRHNDK